MKQRVQTIGDCLNGNSPLARLQEHALHLGRLQRQLALLLPDYLQDSVAVANFRQGVLVLHVASAAIAARMNLILPRLREGFFAQGSAIDELRVKIRPSHAEYRRPAPTRAVSAEALSGIETLRAALPGDSPLSEPLNRLLMHVARKPRNDPLSK
ncbi:MAG: DciA family protein [Betaproteobacteria bacterium]|nr:DciA family protein [Betaproteobacteria bacterium]